MTIKEFIDTYVKNIDKIEFVKICNDLGIETPNGYEENQSLSSEEVERLLSNTRINSYIINNSIISSQDGILDDYNSLIAKYDDLLLQDPAHPENDKVSAADRTHIEGVRNRLIRERDSYKLFLDGLNTKNGQTINNEIFISDGVSGNFIKNPIERKIVELSQDGLKGFDGKLKIEYDKIDDLNQKINSIKRASKKKRYIRKANRIQKRINKLRQKRGKIANIQRTVVNKNTRSYQKYLLQALEISRAEAERKEAFATEKKGYNTDLSDIDYDRKESEKELIALQTSGKFIDRISAVGKKIEINTLNREERKTNRKISALQRKNGFCDFTTQVTRTIRGHNL